MANPGRNIHPLANGRFRVRLWRGGRLFTGTFDTAKQARDFRDAIGLDHELRKRGLGGLLRQRPTVLEAIDSFLDGLRLTHLRPGTQDSYRYALAGPRRFVIEELRRPLLSADEWDDALVSRYVAWRLSHRLTTRARRVPAEPHVVRDLTVLGQAFRAAHVDPAFRIPKRLRRRGVGKRIIPPEEFRRWLEAMPVGSIQRTFAELLANTGMRPCDAAELRRDQVDLAARVIRFEARKTRTAIEIPISETLAQHLQAWLATETVRPMDGRLLHLDGRRIQPSTLRERFVRASKAAGIDPPIAYPGLTRNAVIAQLLAKGIAPYLVAKLVGHSRIPTTFDYARRDNPLDQLRTLTRELDDARESS